MFHCPSTVATLKRRMGPSRQAVGNGGTGRKAEGVEHGPHGGMNETQANPQNGKDLTVEQPVFSTVRGGRRTERSGYDRRGLLASCFLLPASCSLLLPQTEVLCRPLALSAACETTADMVAAREEPRANQQAWRLGHVAGPKSNPGKQSPILFFGPSSGASDLTLEV